MLLSYSISNYCTASWSYWGKGVELVRTNWRGAFSSLSLAKVLVVLEQQLCLYPILFYHWKFGMKTHQHGYLESIKWFYRLNKINQVHKDEKWHIQSWSFGRLLIIYVSFGVCSNKKYHEYISHHAEGWCRSKMYNSNWSCRPIHMFEYLEPMWISLPNKRCTEVEFRS